MSQEKKTKKSVESENKSSGQIVSFDAYFSSLMRAKSGFILPHHKAPMRRYAADAGLTEGTKEEFDKLFQLY